MVPLDVMPGLSSTRATDSPRSHTALPPCRREGLAPTDAHQSGESPGTVADWQGGKSCHRKDLPAAPRLRPACILRRRVGAAARPHPGRPRAAALPGASSRVQCLPSHWAPGRRAWGFERQGGRGSCHTKERNDRNLPAPGVRGGRHTPRFCGCKSRAASREMRRGPSLLAASWAWG